MYYSILGSEINRRLGNTNDQISTHTLHRGAESIQNVEHMKPTHQTALMVLPKRRHTHARYTHILTQSGRITGSYSVIKGKHRNT